MPESLRMIDVDHGQVAVADRGSGPTLLLVHGFPLDHSMWAHQIDHFSSGYRVIAVDLPGFGKSSSVPPRAMAMSQYADALATVASSLEVAEPMTLCGLSMGGYVAWQFYTRYRRLLRGLVICDSRAAADDSATAAGRKVLADAVLSEGVASLAEVMPAKLFAPTTIQTQPQTVARTRAVMAATAPESVSAALQGMAERVDFSDQLARIDCPCLLICGAHDVITPPDEMRDVAQRIPAAQFVQIENAGHMAPLENPAVVNVAIDGFLRSLS